MRRLSWIQVNVLLACLLAGCVLLALSAGSFYFAPAQIARFLAHGLGLGAIAPEETLDLNVFTTLRLPRVLLCGVTGATLGLSGTLMQGLFRNPIVEPGLAGTSAGAALGASSVFVLGNSALSFTAPLGTAAVPVMAFAGGMLATLVVFRIATLFGHTDVLALLLAGIAVNAMCNAGTGFLSYIARDPQARNITFWNLGTFTTADWRGSLLVTAIFLPCLILILRRGKDLNALMLGEDDAAYLGFDPERLVWRLLVLNTLIVSVATAMVGVIAFVGLIVPHMMRLLRSSDYRFLLPASALGGALLMEAIDVVARLVIRPAELPVGIITALIGAPIFLWILLAHRRRIASA
ncbi:FecCD family ABC transporter permease [Sphingomonas quercus]|uniref:Iron ABC transporter permease n=1 Tax=Sphingomonas quercus TaxID=2842451 RepID=A0ABS6BIU7_9SPHN|nr:iron ABC transporter permease [Sphingomonas quercus]MBU3078240.1 iron ABC transporter permease [Sphingomonas quercus]